jgi:hypothetical protein
LHQIFGFVYRLTLSSDSNPSRPFFLPFHVAARSQAKKAGFNKPSVLEKKKNPSAFADMKFRRDALLGRYYSAPLVWVAVLFVGCCCVDSIVSLSHSSSICNVSIVGLERCAGEVVTDMLNIIETCDPDEAQMRLIMRGKSTSALPVSKCGRTL